MKAIVIKRPLTNNEVSAIRKIVKNGSSEIYTSISIPNDLKKYNKGVYSISEEEKKQINYHTIDLTIKFGDQKFAGKTVVDWLKFDESSIWYYHKFRTYFLLRDLKYKLAEIQKLSSVYESVQYYTCETLLSDITIADNVSIILSSTIKKPKWNYASLFNYFLILKTRWILNILSFYKTKNTKHIVLDVSQRQTLIDIQSLALKRGNYLIGYLLDKLGKDFLIIDEAIQPKLMDESKINLKRDHLLGKGSLSNRYFGEGILFNYIFRSKLRKKRKSLTHHIKSSLNKLSELSESVDEKLIIMIYQKMMGATGFYIMKYLAYKHFFQKHSFKTITTVDENSPTRKAILDAARASGMKTLAIQHGNIYDLHPSYLFTANDKLEGVMPDMTLVWGKYYKEFLVQQSNYPEKAVALAGQVRTDVIPALLKANTPVEKIITGVPSEFKIVTFASQPQRDEHLRKQAALEVMNAIRDIPKTYLVIKLHPNESGDHDYYANIAAESGIKNYIISYHIDLYQLISISSVVITCFSTVGSEAVYFGKPLIILDYQKQDLLRYIELKVAFPAYNVIELKNTLTALLNNKLKVNKLAYDNFIREYAYKIDGSVSKRILNAIRTME
ncbi:MAG: CDP-glycerol glycerophosphotransferase family protein [Bacteroidota bacterium]